MSDDLLAGPCHVAPGLSFSHRYWVDQAPQRYIKPYAWVEDVGKTTWPLCTASTGVVCCPAPKLTLAPNHWVGRRNLSAMVTVMDESMGNLTRALKKASHSPPQHLEAAAWTCR